MRRKDETFHQLPNAYNVNRDTAVVGLKIEQDGPADTARIQAATGIELMASKIMIPVRHALVLSLPDSPAPLDPRPGFGIATAGGVVSVDRTGKNRVRP